MFATTLWQLSLTHFLCFQFYISFPCFDDLLSVILFLSQLSPLNSTFFNYVSFSSVYYIVEDDCTYIKAVHFSRLAFFIRKLFQCTRLYIKGILDSWPATLCLVNDWECVHPLSIWIQHNFCGQEKAQATFWVIITYPI